MRINGNALTDKNQNENEKVVFSPAISPFGGQ